MDWNAENWTEISANGNGINWVALGVIIAIIGSIIIPLVIHLVIPSYQRRKSEKRRIKDKIVRPFCGEIDKLKKRVEDFEETSTFEISLDKAKRDLPKYKKEIDDLLKTMKEYNELLTSAKYFIKYGMYICCSYKNVKKLMNEFDELDSGSELTYKNLSSNLAGFFTKFILKGEDVEIHLLEGNSTFMHYIKKCKHSSDLYEIPDLIEKDIIEVGNGIFKRVRKEQESVITNVNDLKQKLELDYKLGGD